MLCTKCQLQQSSWKLVAAIAKRWRYTSLGGAPTEYNDDTKGHSEEESCVLKLPSSIPHAASLVAIVCNARGQNLQQQGFSLSVADAIHEVLVAWR
jgi:hypothetical protein